MKPLARICTLLLLAGTLAAQNNTSPLSADLARYYFPSPAAEEAARADLDHALDQLSRFHGQINSAQQLLRALQTYDSLLELFHKHEAYLHLLCARNRKDPACEARDNLESQVDSKTAFLTPEILAVPEDRLRAWLSQEPALTPYRFELDDMRHDTAHVLPAPEQSLLDEFQSHIAGWQYDLYQQLVAGIPFGAVHSSGGDLDVIRQRTLIAASPDAKVREEGFRRRFNGYASRRDLLAFALIHTVQARDLLAKSHHYADAPAQKYHSLYFDPADARNLLDQMAKHGDIAKRYQKTRSFDFEREYHMPAHAWDLSAPTPGFAPPIISLVEARSIFHQAFAGLGNEYQAAFDALLDPANGRADIVPGGAANRYGGGFSIGSTGTASVLFYGRYDGTFKDLSVIAHEGGHATHRQSMSSNHVSPAYGRGPNFLSESFAEFNELVLADYMAEHASSPELIRYYRERWLDIKGLDAFYGAQDALLEQAIYDGVAKGTIRNADDLDELTVQVDSQFSQFAAATPEMKTRWAMVSLMYEDPLYDVNYAYGGLLALKYYHLYTTRRDWFVPRYIALLNNGFNQPPADLLKQFLEIDLTSPSLLADGLTVLNSRLLELESATPRN